MDEQTPVDQPPGSGHQAMPHTADVRVVAWAPTPEGCVAEAVSGMVEAFADPTAARATVDRHCLAAGDTEEELLLSVLEEVIYRMDTAGEIPVETTVEPVGTGQDGRRATAVRFRMVSTDDAEPVGAVPKAVSLHDLRFRGGPDGWRCHVTLDV